MDAVLTSCVPQRASYFLRLPEPRGLVELRSVLAGQLARTRSVVASNTRLGIVDGFSAGLSSLAETFWHRGIERITVEGPMFPLHTDLLKLAGLAVVMVTQGISTRPESP
jgi:aspartate/methionine/tyrosine aminotransferase